MADRKHDIERYLRGELSSEEMHALEKEALSDPFLAEALEGIEQAGPDNFLYDLHAIRRSVHDRVRNTSRKKNKVIRIWAWTGAIAATLLLIAVSGFIVLKLIREQAARQQAMREEAERIPPEFFEKDTLVIALPAQSTVERKSDAPRHVASAPGLNPPAPLIADADLDTLKQLDTQDTSPIAGYARNQTNEDEIPQVTESIAKAETADVAQLKSAARMAEEESVLRSKKESEREPAPGHRSGAVTRTADNAIVLRGKVVDADGVPLSGVNVVVKNTSTATTTNVDGEYKLQVPPGHAELVFAFIGFASQEITIDGREEINVTLNEDVASLSEVVVVGYGSTSPNTTENTSFHPAEPIGGRSDFKKYLENAVKYPAEAVNRKVEGRVTIRFTVEPDGQLTNFEVLKGIGSGAEEALITAIKSGPAWKPGMRGDQPITDNVKVRYRFKLPE